MAAAATDWEGWKWKLLRALWKRQNDWRTFHSLSLEIIGDPGSSDVLEAIANGDRTLFAVQEGRRVKLTPEACRLIAAAVEKVGAEAEHGPQPVEADPHQSATHAVQVYAQQLYPYHVNVREISRGQKIKDRFLHTLTLADEDDDIRLVDDTPVTLISSQHSNNFGHIVGTSRTDSTLFVAFQHEVLAHDLPARLTIYRNKIWLDLAERLQQLNGVPERAADLSAMQRQPVIENQDGRRLAFDLAQLAAPWSRLLWGPPGSGKTFSVGWLASKLVNLPDERVLVVAPSNVAVDVATLELVRALQ